jgi:hypothetical protein
MIPSGVRRGLRQAPPQMPGPAFCEEFSMSLSDDDITAGSGASLEGPADGGANPGGTDGGADGGASGEGPADGGEPRR